ncbi:MAG: hypothetical protein GC180_02560 [Bacteroidetes bacterium]|nr:hypothetical protein [Bacteroidota bacterium]
MKNFVKLMTFILCLSTASAYAQSEDRENALVEKVLQNMVNSSSMTVGSYISPAYLKAHDVSPSDYQINTYSPSGFTVDQNKGHGVVVARIWGSGHSWTHRLTFIVTYEDGSYYFMPGRAPSEYSYIDPWYLVETNIVDQVEEKTSTPSVTQSRELVNKILYDMVNDQDDFGTSARKYIAPSYYKKEHLDKYDYKINYYSPKGSEIKEVRSDGIVTAYIWGSDKSWVNLLTFKVVMENGQAYVWPKGHTDNNYIHPWYEVEKDVTYEGPKKGGNDNIKKDEKTELVEKICYAMCYAKDDFATEMRLYIAPSYYKRENIDPFSYKVNSYSPVGYSLESYSGNIIKVKIWGEDRGWVHELTFKVVEESGLYYVMPGKYYSETKYVDPWYSVETYVE